MYAQDHDLKQPEGAAGEGFQSFCRCWLGPDVLARQVLTSDKKTGKHQGT